MKTHSGRILAAAGFTLIEVLLTMVLAAALLSALWTLLSMHVKLFDAGQTKTEQSQLARTLMKQMSDDLHSVVQAPPPVPPIAPPTGQPMVAAAPANSGSSTQSAGANNAPPSSAANTPRPQPSSAGASANLASTVQAAQPVAPRPLTGQPNSSASPAASPSNSSTPNSSTSAQSNPNAASSAPNPSAMRGGQKSVTVTSSLRPAGLVGTETSLQIDVLQSTIVREEVDPDGRRPGAEIRSRADDLRTVIYSFEETRDPKHPLDEPRTALRRREVDWELAHAAASGRDRGLASRAGGTLGMVNTTIPLEPRPEGASDKSTETAPEVVQFGMRYFDGSQWSSEWDSVARQGLPIAIEVAMQLRSFDEPEPNHHLANEAPNEDPKLTQPKMPIYRLVIHLPSGARQPSGGRGQSGASGLRGAKPPLGADSRGSRR